MELYGLWSPVLHCLIQTLAERFKELSKLTARALAIEYTSQPRLTSGKSLGKVYIPWIDV